MLPTGRMGGWLEADRCAPTRGPHPGSARPLPCWPGAGAGPGPASGWWSAGWSRMTARRPAAGRRSGAGSARLWVTTRPAWRADAGDAEPGWTADATGRLRPPAPQELRTPARRIRDGHPAAGQKHHGRDGEGTRSRCAAASRTRGRRAWHPSLPLSGGPAMGRVPAAFLRPLTSQEQGGRTNSPIMTAYARTPAPTPAHRRAASSRRPGTARGRAYPMNRLSGPAA